MNCNRLWSYLISLLLITCTCSVNSSCSSSEDEDFSFNRFYTDSTKTQSVLNDSVLIVAHWNIGHFSQGKSSDTSITAQDTDSLKALYLDMIKNVCPDIFGICEYNPTFNANGENTAQLLFSSFPYSYIGYKYDYNCNSIFSCLPLYNCAQYFFPESVQTRYFSVADISLNETTVKFVETHLDFNQNANGQKCRLSQMKELIDAFKDYPYVVICADYNSSVREEYDVFLEAGFSLATDGLPNAGSPSSNTSLIMIDNIIVKGFQVKETVVYPHNSLSDHDVLWCCMKIND